MTVLTPSPPQWRKHEPPPDGYVTAAAFDGVVTYRCLDYWTRAGWLRSNGEPGSGQNRLWPAGEVPVARAIRRLLDAGLSAEVARTVARGGSGEAQLDQGVRLVTDQAVWESS